MKVTNFLLLNVAFVALAISCVYAMEKLPENEIQTDDFVVVSSESDLIAAQVREGQVQVNQQILEDEEYLNEIISNVNEKPRADLNAPQVNSNEQGNSLQSEAPTTEQNDSSKQVKDDETPFFLQSVISFWNIIAMAFGAVALLIGALIIRYEYQKQSEEF